MVLRFSFAFPIYLVARLHAPFSSGKIQLLVLPENTLQIQNKRIPDVLIHEGVQKADLTFRMVFIFLKLIHTREVFANASLDGRVVLNQVAPADFDEV